MPEADLLTLGEVHAIRVVPAGDGLRAAPFVLRDGEWHPATAGDGAAVALVERLYDADAPTPAGFRVTAPEKPPVTLDADDERAMGVDQTHQSWVVGGQVVVKWMTEPLVGPHPAPGRLRRLAAAGFAESPALWGLVEWRDARTGHSHTSRAPRTDGPGRSPRRGGRSASSPAGPRTSQPTSVRSSAGCTWRWPGTSPRS